MTELTIRFVRPIGRLSWLAWAIALPLALAFTAGAAAYGVRSLLYRGEVMPGVRVNHVVLSGLTAREAGEEVRRLVAAELARPAAIEAGGERIRIRPNQLFTLDRAATEAALLDANRTSVPTRVEAFLHPTVREARVFPVLKERPRARARLTALLAPYTEAAKPATIRMDGLEPIVVPGEPGTVPDLDAVLADVEQRVLLVGKAIEIRAHLRAVPPAVDERAARAAADEVRLMLAKPTALTVRGDAVGALAPFQLARALTFRAHEDRLLVLPDAEKLARILDPRVGPWKERARNAQFTVDGERVTIVPSEDGIGIDARATMVNVNTAAHVEGERTAEIVLTSVAPDRTTAEAEALGIRERLSSFTTDMGVSSANRIHNVQLMANYIDGTIIRPGQTFSFNGTVGPRTPERGFLEGQMIVGSLLLPSIGGGVCQTATTLFNNAFELGLPIVERHNHSFYISHYPLGRDATVSWGGPDFAFRNDLENALLIKASYTDETLTFTFYGTDEGRKVVARTGPQTNWREPKTTYALDPYAPRGSMRQVSGDHQSGFDISVYRTVTKDGKVLRKDSFASKYIPVGDTVVYGPGSSIPGPYFVIPKT